MKFDNKKKRIIINLLKDGYYFRPCVYDNTTIYELTKDFNPCGDPKPIASRRTYAEFNGFTAHKLSKMFGFVIKNGGEYFGSIETIGNWMQRYYVNHDVQKLIN